MQVTHKCVYYIISHYPINQKPLYYVQNASSFLGREYALSLHFLLEPIQKHIFTQIIRQIAL